MKAIRMVEAGKPLEQQNIPIPAIGEKDILVRVRAAGICHSDVHYVATDPMGIELTDFFIALKPRDEWKKARTQRN